VFCRFFRNRIANRQLGSIIRVPTERTGTRFAHCPYLPFCPGASLFAGAALFASEESSTPVSVHPSGPVVSERSRRETERSSGVVPGKGRQGGGPAIYGFPGDLAALHHSGEQAGRRRL